MARSFQWLCLSRIAAQTGGTSESSEYPYVLVFVTTTSSLFVLFLRGDLMLERPRLRSPSWAAVAFNTTAENAWEL